MSFVWPTSHVGMAHPLSEQKNARDIGNDFLKMADSALRGISYSESKGLLNCSAHQAETRKSLFEEIGLLYVPSGSNTIILTPVGQQLIELLGIEPDLPSSKNLNYLVDKILIWSLLQVQINRPQSRGAPKPAADDWQNCDIKPYATFWMSTLDLDGFITMREFFGVIRQLQKVDQYHAAIQRIKDARADGIFLFDAKQYENRAPLMNPRIYWNAHLSLAGNLFDYDKYKDALVLRENRRELLLNLFRLTGESTVQQLKAKPWSDIHEYYSRFSKVEFKESTSTDISVKQEGKVLVPLSTKSVFVEAPKAKRVRKKIVDKKRKAQTVDYKKIGAENEILGFNGEEYVLKVEQLRLKEAGLHELAENIVWVSKEIGDGLGYDIQSFDLNGDELYIEVKTTNSGITSPFFISINEVEAAKEFSGKYVLYRVFDFSNNPRIYKVFSPLEDYLTLDPVTFRASLISSEY